MKYLERLFTHAVDYVPVVLLALVTLIVGWKLAGYAGGVMKASMRKREVDATLRSFLQTFVEVVLKVAVVVSVIQILGVGIASFVAVLGAAGLAIGLALSGTLQNFAGGVVLLFLRPFKVGDFIEAQGHMGTVQEIQVFHTVLTTPDNRRVVLPNAPLSSGSLVNFSSEPRRRIDWVFSIGYGDDIDKAREILMELLRGDERVLDDPAPAVMVTELGESSVDLTARVWAEAPNFWPLFWDMQERVKKAFDAKGINIPFPQRDVHLFDARK